MCSRRRAVSSHVSLVADEIFEDAPKVQLLGLALCDGGHVHAEGALEVRILEQGLEDLLRVRVLLDLHHRPHALSVRFVPDVRHAREHGLLLLGHGQDLLERRRLVDPIGDLGDDDEGLAVLQLLEVGLGPHGQLPPAGLVGRGDLRGVDEIPAGGEVRGGHDLHELLQADLGVVDHGHGGVDGLAGVVGRDVGGQAHRDARGPVDEEVGEPARQQVRLLQGVVEVQRIVHRVEVDIPQKLHGRVGHAGLGVPHGGGGVPVDGAEVAMAVHQGQTHGEGLGHVDHGLIDGAVPVGMVFAQAVTHDAGALSMGLVRGQAQLQHGVEDAPLDGLQAVLHPRQGPFQNDVLRVGDHGVVHDLVHAAVEDDLLLLGFFDLLAHCRSLSFSKAVLSLLKSA